jgi:exodeoxyribonuclease-3
MAPSCAGVFSRSIIHDILKVLFMTITVATWNINSIRLRLPLLAKFIQEENPDIICLQETKVADEFFPLKALHDLGYPHVVFRGQKSYNGVAILSKIPLSNPYRLDLAGFDDARHIAATLSDGTELHNLYIPAGGDEPDITINPKFKHKLDVVDYLTQWFKDQRTMDHPMIIAGDFNIAPHEHDVWSHKQLLTVVSHTPIEVEKLSYMQQSLSWIDGSRHFVDKNEKLYSWWSYRNRDWKKSNRGRRLDHIWVTPVMKDRLIAHKISQPMRDWTQPSDHVPVVLSIKKLVSA